MSKHDEVSPMSFFSFQDIMACVTGIMILVCLILALDPLGDVPSSARVPGQSQQLQQALDAARSRAGEARKALAEARAALAEAQARPIVTADQLARLERLVAKERDGLIALERSRESASGDAQRQEDQTLLVNQQSERAREGVRAIKQDLADKSLRARVQYQAGEREQLRPLLCEVTANELRLGELDANGTPKPLASVRDVSATEVMRAWGSGTAASGAPHASAPLEAVLQAHPKNEWYLLLIVRDDSVQLSNGLRDLARARGYEVGWQLWDAKEGGFFDVPAESLP